MTKPPHSAIPACSQQSEVSWHKYRSFWNLCGAQRKAPQPSTRDTEARPSLRLPISEPPSFCPHPPLSPSPEPPFGEPRINHLSTSAGRSAAQPRSPGPGSVLHRGFERLGASAASCVQWECCEHLPRRVAGRPNRLELGVQDAQLGPEATGQWEGRAGRFCHRRASALPLPPQHPLPRSGPRLHPKPHSEILSAFAHSFLPVMFISKVTHRGDESTKQAFDFQSC